MNAGDTCQTQFRQSQLRKIPTIAGLWVILPREDLTLRKQLAAGQRRVLPLLLSFRSVKSPMKPLLLSFTRQRNNSVGQKSDTSGRTLAEELWDRE